VLTAATKNNTEIRISDGQIGCPLEKGMMKLILSYLNLYCFIDVAMFSVMTPSMVHQ
jgi:hypothetical protein